MPCSWIGARGGVFFTRTVTRSVAIAPDRSSASRRSVYSEPSTRLSVFQADNEFAVMATGERRSSSQLVGAAPVPMKRRYSLKSAGALAVPRTSIRPAAYAFWVGAKICATGSLVVTTTRPSLDGSLSLPAWSTTFTV